MPCESCNVQFTVFRRKRLCTECRRFYCNQCLVKRHDKILCERCVVLTARPLSKVDLLKLKPKDLIFYLQSKHISTTGCVEKEELVNLVMSHVNGTPGSRSSQSSNRTSPQDASTATTADAAAPEDATNEDFENCSNPFDQIKQTCQNLFSSFADKIVDFNFENKPANSTANNQQGNVFNQPRFQTREMPSYASSAQQVPNVQPQARIVPPTMARNSSSTTDLRNVNRTNAAAQSQSTSSSNPSSPIISLGSISSHGSSMQPTVPTHQSLRPSTQPGSGNANMPTVHQSNLRRFIDNIQDVNASGCECSDDEVLAEFANRRNSRADPSSNFNLGKTSPPSQTDSAFEDQIPGPSGSGAHSAASTSQLSSGENPKSSEESSASSFEELGAVGGGAAMNEWQIVDKTDVMQPPPTQTPRTPSTSSAANATFPSHSSVTTENVEQRKAPHKPRRLNRRRSDSCMVQASSSRSQDEMPDRTPMEIDESDDATEENLSCKRSRKCCHKCGKTKNNLKSKLMKFRRQLETQHMSEVEIKREIEEFLNYLESKAKDSFDCSDSENHCVPQVQIEDMSDTTGAVASNEIALSRDDDGIHVYGSTEDESWRHIGRFLDLGDFKSRSELEDLSVKQLKEILMLNRVDFKGCCEKTELLDRVHRLWDDLQTSPAVDRLPTDDLCKICMDAPIECVILECGHVATCTNCGKVLSECPICRQYIVRVVRFFRA